MTNVYFNLIQREEMARNLWVYLCTHQGVKSAKSMSAGSEAEGRVTEGRASNKHPFSIHSVSIQHPLQSGGNKVKTSLRFLRYVAMIFAVLVMSVANIGIAWGAVGTSASTTFTCGTTSTSGVSYAFTYDSNGANSDTIIFHAASLYSSSVTYAYYSGSAPATSSQDFAPRIYNAVNGTSLSSSKGIYSASGSSNPSELRVQSGKILWVKVTNCTSVLLSGKSGGSRTTNLDVYLASNTSTPITNGSKTIANTANTVEVTGMSASNTYLIKISGSTTSNCAVYELALVYPHAGGGGSTYSITYHCNDATSGCPATNPATEQTALPSPLPSVTKTNYTFGGWYTDAAYSSAASAGATLSANADLYAKWTQTITLDREGATTGSTSVTATYNSATLPSITNPTKDGFVFEGWYDGDNGTGNLVINTSGALQANVSGYTGADGIWTSATVRTLYAKWTEKTCPSSGTLYTAAVKSSVSSNQSFPASATTEVSPTTQADITGGQLFAINGESSAKNLIASSSGYKFCMTNNSTKFKLVLECELQVGDIITIDGVGGTKNDAPIGLWVSSSDSRPGSAPACSGTSTTTSLVDDLVNYTVTSSDEYHGKSILYIHRAVGSSTYFNNINISRPAAPSCTKPNHVDISGNYHFFPGETLALTATAYSTAGTSDPIAAGDITGYQWQKYIGTDWESIVGETSATYTKANATTSDVGQYRCIVSTGATCSTTSGTFNAKCLQLYVYWDNKSDKCNLPFTKVDGTHATVNVSLENGSYTYYYKVTDGCGNWWGNDGTMTSSNCSGWNLNVNNHCGLTTTKAAAYTFNLTYNAGVDAFSMSVVYPSSVQVGGYNLYFANDERNWSNIHYRIGRSNWNSKAAMTLVPGTANLYQTTTIHYESDGGFEAWHIANNGGWSDGNSIYKTNTGDGNAITNATRFEGAPVPSTGLTVIPGSDHSTGGDAQNNNCEFYSYTSVPGMKTQNVAISPYSNGTITVNYTNTSNVASTLTSGNADLAHTVILTSITAVANTGYDASAITINGNAYTANYVVTGATTIAATFTPHVYSITYLDQGGSAFSGSHVDSPNAHPTNHTYNTATTLNSATKAGYTFGGWYTNSACTGDAVTSLGATDYTADITLYAKWTAAASLTALECNTRYTVQDMTAGGCGTLSSTSCYSAGLSANNRFEVLGDPSLQGNDGGTPEQKTNTAQTINSISFNSFMYLKGDGLNGSTEPTCRGVKFIIPSAGKLTIYYRYGDRSKLKKEGEDAVNVGTTTGGYGYDTHEVTAGTYYIYGASSGAVLIAVEYQCCTTPAAPTAFANTAVTSTTATFSITDAADAASYDLYYASGSPSTPTAGTNATENVTTKTPTITGLTASTTYKIWVRSVCDADHKSAWVALGTTSFTTSAAEPTALVTWQMKVDQAAWALKSGTTEDGTNITSIASTADEPGSTSTGITGTTGKVVMASGESNVDKAASFTFTVNSAKKVVPEKVTCKVLNVSSGNRTYKAQLSDNNGHVYYSTNTVSVTTENVLTDATFNFASSLVLTGNVTLKVYAWKTSGSPTQFRMGEYVKLFGEVQNAADYTVTHTMSNVTKSAGATSVKEGNNYTATYAGAGGYALPSTITVTIGGSPATAGTDYTWTQGTGVVTIPGNKVTGNIVITVTGVAPAPTYSVTHNLSNVTATSGATGAGAATEGVAYNAVFAANSGYVLPSTITVTIGGSPATVGTGYTWNASTGAFQVPAAQVTGAIVITIAGETAPATKDIYYGAITITTGALTRGSTGTVQFFTNTGGTIANNTEISLSTTLGAGSEYYLSNDLTGAELSKSSNWTTSSSSNRYVQGVKFGSGKSYTLALGSKVASSITFYGINGSASKTMTIGGQAWTSSSTKNTFAKHEFTKSGGFTGSVSITQDGDFYGILVITIQTATPCTTPVIPALSNQSLCEGTDIAAWSATVTNAAAIEAAGETVAYSWKKKGNDTELANTATFDLGSSATESQAGTYVVTVTVSKAGKASSSAYREVELSVTDGEEVTGITADKATVYPGNSVTLTATANTPATWQWYTCTNAEGDGEAIISGAESASFTIASAGAADTYYYKAKATGSCGTAERVYTLVVSPAAGGDCFHFVSVIPESNINISSGASIVTPTHATTLEGGTMKVGSQQVVITAGYGLKMEGNKTVSITLDAALEAGNVVIVKGTSGTKGYGITINGVNFYDADNKTFDVSYTVLADDGLVGQTALTVSKYSGSSYLQEIKITGCGEACTDPEVTASADNTTACVGTSVTFTAANAHASATYQWQKLDGTWTNISDATASTYNIPSVVAGDAGKYRVIATHGCSRTSNEVTLSVPLAPDFGSTVPASVSVMQTIALSINTVEATDAVKYRWYKSADAIWDAGDTEIGTNKELIKAYDSEAIGSPSYYIFCRAQNACGITTSTAIAVNVTTYVEEDCATRGNEGDAEFGFENTSCSQGTYSETAVWTTNSRSKYLTYTAPEGKYFKTAKVTVAVTSGSKCGYAYSTDGGTTWTYAELTSLSSTLTEKTINLSALGGGVIDAFRISRNLQDGGGTDHGVTSGNFHLSKACFEYTDACTATTVTPSTSSVNYEMGGEWSNPTFTLSVAGTLTYSSSNEDIASVDDDGTVTFNGEAGTVTITASYAGGTISATEYCASSGSYIINVSCPGGAPKVEADGSTDMVGCNTSVTLHAKKQDGTAFADGTYQWFRNGEEIDGATSSSYTATQAGTYTVERTNGTGCTTPSTNSAVVTSETTEPEVERLVPFQYYHVDSIYRETSIMRFRHLFAVKNSGKLDGKSFKMYVSRNGGAATDVTSSNALVVVPNGDGHVDTVMVDLNKLSGKYSEDDELVFTCKAIDCNKNVSDVYKETITMNVIGATPTLALICSGSNKAGGTRKTGELTVGGDFLTGYNVADLCQQTGNTSFDANTEWGLYTRLKENYIVTPVNGYAVFNKLNYEPFDILLLTDYPKASKSDAAATVLDDMADLCDYRPMLSFKAHMVSKTPSKWAAKGFTTSPVVPKNTRTRLNIVCYAHPMFSTLKSTATHIQKDNDDPSQIVYTMLTGAGYEGSKGLQGFELEAAENFVTIGLVHYNATPADGSPSAGLVTWTPGSEDRMLVTAVERQENLEARMIMFAVNCGAQSKFTETGRNVVLKCLEYLLDDDPLHVADCSFTFDNGAGNSMTAAQQAEACESCTGTKGDGKWSTAANWGPDYVVRPGKDTEVKIAAPVTVDPAVGAGAATNFTPKVRSVRILEGGKVEIPAGSYLEVVSTIRRQDGNDIYPTEVEDLHIGSSTTGNGTLIFNNSTEDTKAQVDMYSKGFIDHTDPANEPKGVKNYQYIGTPFVEVNALYNYYGSWIYYWKADGSGWKAVKNGGPMTAWTGYCITQEAPTYHQMSGTLTATGTVDINVPADANMVVGNSWTAPIDINALTTDDLEGLTASIYFFNTGVDKKGEGTTTANATGDARWAGGTYVSVPIHSAPYTGDDHIPSLQGFFVKNTGGSAGTLHLDYDKHVRGSSRAGRLSEEMHAPARRIALSSDEPVVLKMKVSGENYDDKLLLLEREDFTEGFDNGWDGDKWDGNESALYIYTTDNEGTENSVSAVPELEGTIIGFRAGEEDDAYTLNFEYLNSDEPLYLYDSENSTYTRIMTGVTYRFFTTDKSKHARFIITRKSPQITTAVGNVSDDGLRSSKVKKLLLDNKLFILRNGMLYDATGKVVK